MTDSNNEDTLPFAFYDPGQLQDDDLQLRLVKTSLGIPGSGYVPTYFFRMIHAYREEEMGSITLRIGNTRHIVMYAGHIGYSVDSLYRGHHYAARACRLLLPLAHRHHLDTLWITCNPDNFPSRKTCERIGAQLVEIVDLPEETDMHRRGERQKCRYRLTLLASAQGS